MSRVMLRTVALAALPGGALLAQDITGSWQGPLQPPGGKQELRVVFKYRGIRTA
jgi:hypothetical protein